MTTQPATTTKKKTNKRWYLYAKQSHYYKLIAGNLCYASIWTDEGVRDKMAGGVDFYAMHFEPPVDPRYHSHAEELLAIQRELETKD